MWWQFVLAWSSFLTGTLAGIQWGRHMRGTSESERMDYSYLEGVYAGEKAIRDDIRVIVLADDDERDSMLRMPTIEESNNAGIPLPRESDENLPGVNYFKK